MKTAVFVGDLFEDLICVTDTEHIDSIRDTQSKSCHIRGVYRSSREQQNLLIGSVKDEDWARSWGGPVFNTTKHFATLGKVVPRKWATTYLYGPPLGSWREKSFGINALDSLRKSCVQPVRALSSIRTGTSAIFVERQHRAVKLININEASEIGKLLFDVSSDLVVGYARDFAKLSKGAIYSFKYRRVGVILGDFGPETEADTIELDAFANSCEAAYFFGHEREFRLWRLLKNGSLVMRRSNFGAYREAVITCGSEPVRISSSNGEHEIFAPRFIDDVSAGTDLGAGDAFAAGYLFERAAGENRAKSYSSGLGAATKVLAAKSANQDWPADLRKVFGEAISRSSHSSTDGEAFDIVRNAPGPVVISGGQTGIDELALQQAGRLGLPTFAIMPEGYRTEGKTGFRSAISRMPEASLVELGSSSFRYRTWVAVYCGDGTLVWDFARSEGSVETVSACTTVSRC